MAKQIKFPLEMGDGTQARSMEELKAHFDIDKVVEYALDGKLVTWLDARYYTKEAEAVKRLDIHSEGVKGELCAIFGVEIADNASEVDVEAIQLRKERLLKLKEYTDREEIWDKIDNVAFDQEELGDRLDEDCQEIYLCGEMFTVPYSVKGKTYIGINNPRVCVNGEGKLELDVQEIEVRECNLQTDNLIIKSVQIEEVADESDFMQIVNDATPFEGYKLEKEIYRNDLVLRIYADDYYPKSWKFLVLDTAKQEYQKFEPIKQEEVHIYSISFENDILFLNMEWICIRYEDSLSFWNSDGRVLVYNTYGGSYPADVKIYNGRAFYYKEYNHTAEVGSVKLSGENAEWEGCINISEDYLKYIIIYNDSLLLLKKESDSYSIMSYDLDGRFQKKLSTLSSDHIRNVLQVGNSIFYIDVSRSSYVDATHYNLYEYDLTRNKYRELGAVCMNKKETLFVSRKVELFIKEGIVNVIVKGWNSDEKTETMQYNITTGEKNYL